MLWATGLGRPEYYFHYDRLRDNFNHTAINLMKGGIVYSNYINTVSPHHSWEARFTDQGYGLGQTLAIHHYKFGGILNGVDYDVWNPEIDRFIPSHYHVWNIDAKYPNKDALRDRLWLRKEFKPIVAYVGRLDAQKGVHLIQHAMFYTLEQGGQFVLLGAGGDRGINNHFWHLKHYLNDNSDCHIEIGFNEQLAHLIYAGADIAIVPSLFEPCGLTQMIAMRYGTVPLVRAVGGLVDTVFDRDTSDKPPEQRNGYVFKDADFRGVESALSRAIGLWGAYPKEFRRLISNGMAMDYLLGRVRPALHRRLRAHPLQVSLYVRAASGGRSTGRRRIRPIGRRRRLIGQIAQHLAGAGEVIGDAVEVVVRLVGPGVAPVEVAARLRTQEHPLRLAQVMTDVRRVVRRARRHPPEPVIFAAEIMHPRHRVALRLAALPLVKVPAVMGVGVPGTAADGDVAVGAEAIEIGVDVGRPQGRIAGADLVERLRIEIVPEIGLGIDVAEPAAVVAVGGGGDQRREIAPSGALDDLVGEPAIVHARELGVREVTVANDDDDLGAVVGAPVRPVAQLLPAHLADRIDVFGIDDDVAIAGLHQVRDQRHVEGQLRRPESREPGAPEDVPGDRLPAGDLLVPVRLRRQGQDRVIVAGAEDREDLAFCSAHRSVPQSTMP